MTHLHSDSANEERDDEDDLVLEGQTVVNGPNVRPEINEDEDDE